MNESGISRIVVNGTERILADEGKGLAPRLQSFLTTEAAMEAAAALIAQAGGTLNEQPIQEFSLSNGGHVTLVKPPVAVNGPLIEIDLNNQPHSLDVLIGALTLSQEMAEVLRSAVATKRNIIVTGPIGAGVTEVLGALASQVGEEERMVLVEEHADLRIEHNGVTALSTLGGSALTLSSLIRRATKLHSDRLIIDDVQGNDVGDALVAMAAREYGVMCGVHAPSDENPTAPIELFAGSESELIGRCVHVVVQVALYEGIRRVTSISEVTGSSEGRAVSQVLFVFDGESFASSATASFV